MPAKSFHIAGRTNEAWVEITCQACRRKRVVKRRTWLRSIRWLAQPCPHCGFRPISGHD